MSNTTNKAKGNKVTEAAENVLANTSIINAHKAEAEAKAAEVAEAHKATSEAKKAAKAATKEAEKAAAKAAKPEATKEAKAEAKKAASAAKKAAEAVTKAEAVETAAADKVTKAKEAAKAATIKEAAAAGSLTIKAEAVRKGLNAAVRALLESASEASADEINALLAFVGRPYVSEGKAAKAAAEVTKNEVIAAYRAFSTFAVCTESGGKSVAKAVRAYIGANVFTFEAATSYTIGAIFRSPAANKRRGRKQFTAEAGQFYEVTKGGKYEPITAAEAAARIKAAEIAEAAEAERKAKAEAQAEADRKRGEAVRKAEEKADKVGRAKAAKEAAEVAA